MYVRGYLQGGENGRVVTIVPRHVADTDTYWLLIYFMILLAFYLFRLLKSKCHEIGECQYLNFNKEKHM